MIRKISKLVYLFLFLPLAGTLQAQELKSVAILDIINISEDQNYYYLEASLRDAIREKLKKEYAFHEVTPEDYEAVAKENFIFQNDYYTKTAALNLGLLAKADIVINGSFSIEENEGDSEVVINVVLYDCAKKSVIFQINERGPAGSGLFRTIDIITNIIIAKSARVLPSKEEYQRKGITSTEKPKPVFDNLSLSLMSGGVLYYGGYSKYFRPEQPAFTFNLQYFVPIIWKRLFLQTEFSYFKHTLKAGNDSIVQSVNMVGTTSNYTLQEFLGIEFPMGKRFSFNPKIGGGYTFQTTTISGVASDTFNNGFPIFGGGINIVYSFNKNLGLDLGVLGLCELENNVFTYVFQGQVGFRLRI